jgi:hypothetical protein
MLGFWSITRNTFTQTIRQPVYGVIIVATFALLVLNVPLSGWTIGTQTRDYHTTDQRMLENIGLSTLLVSGLLVAAFSASAAVGREIEDKTALTVISKPVSRATFVLGKFAGVVLAVAVAFYLCALVYLLTIRHGVKPAAWDEPDVPVIVLGLSAFGLTIAAALLGNLYFGWSFVPAGVRAGAVLLTAAMGIVAFVGKGWEIVPFGQEIRPELFAGMALMLLAVLIFAAVAIAASTRLAAAPTLLVCVGVLVVGLMHPFLFGRWAADIVVVRALGWVVPNLSYFDPQDALTADESIPARYLLLAAAYSGVYVAGVLAVAMALFQRRQLEATASAQSSLPTLPALVGGIGRLGGVLTVFAGLVLLSISLHPMDTSGIALGAGLLPTGAVTWVVWGAFLKRRRWAYYVVLISAGISIARFIGMFVIAQLHFRGTPVVLPSPNRAVTVGFQAAAAGLLIVILLLPKTRRHFQSEA